MRNSTTSRGVCARCAVEHLRSAVASLSTVRVRRGMCGACRSLLGHARDKVSFFRRCAGYLGLPPYAAMKQGWAEWYKDE